MNKTKYIACHVFRFKVSLSCFELLNIKQIHRGFFFIDFIKLKFEHATIINATVFTIVILISFHECPILNVAFSRIFIYIKWTINYEKLDFLRTKDWFLLFIFCKWFYIVSESLTNGWFLTSPDSNRLFHTLITKPL